MLDRENFLEVVFRMTSALQTILLMDEEEKLESVVLGLGYTVEELQAMSDFIKENITKKESDEMMLKNSFFKYVEALDDMKELISQMEQGYVEMGNINLQIANENAQIIDEGVNVNEVDTKDAKTGS